MKVCTHDNGCWSEMRTRDSIHFGKKIKYYKSGQEPSLVNFPFNTFKRANLTNLSAKKEGYSSEKSCALLVRGNRGGSSRMGPKMKTVHQE